MISEEEMSDLIMEKNKARRNEAIDKMTEEDAKHFLKKAAFSHEPEHRALKKRRPRSGSTGGRK